MRTHRMAAVMLLLTAGSGLALPTTARADCGGDYVRCLSDSGALGTSEAFHESACYAAYVSCVGRMLLRY